MANLIVNEGTFRADLFKIASYLDYETASTSSTQVELYSRGGSFVRRLTGDDFTSDGDGAPLSGTITGITEIKDGVPLFTLSGFSMSWTAFKTFGIANDTEGFLAQVLSGDDALSGNGLKDVIAGFDGADTITGGHGDDRIMGEDGADRLDGGEGKDVLLGGEGDDTYIVDTRYDRVIEKADEGFDCIHSALSWSLGSALEELILTGGDDIRGTGNSLDNRLTGNTGDNVLDGKRGADTMAGDFGDDLYIVDDESDVVIEAASEGSDTVNSAIDYTLGDHVEHLKLLGKVTGGTGNTLNNQITGNRYTNVLDGGAGDDTLKAGSGNDTLTGGDGDDILYGYKGTDCASYAGASGAVTVDLAMTGAQNTGGAGIDILSSIERLIGSDFGDTLTGNTRYNRIDGGAGADTMTGGTGNDTYVVDDAGDTMVEAARGGYDVVESSVSHVLADNIERLNLTGTGDTDGTGNAGKNVLKGNDGANRLDGGAGRDAMYGGLGDDTYVVDDRYDRVVEYKNAGTDEVKSAVHFALASTLEHLELTGSDDIRGTGNSLDNRLTGNTGNNRLAAKQGNDTLDGGAGDDTLEGGSGDDLYVISGNLGDHDVIKEYRGVDTLRFDGVDPFVEVTLVERAGYDLVFRFQAGGSLTLYQFFRGKPVEILEAWGLPFDMPTDFEGSASLASYLGVDVSTATAGDDVIVGENGSNDHIHGLDGNDRIAGVGGDDTLSGDDGDDALSGGAGNDVLVGGLGADSMDGGTGSDTASYAGSDAAVNVNLNDGDGTGGHADGDTLINIENLTGSDHGDTLTGDGGANVLVGGDGDDLLIGGDGGDSLVGGDGVDTASYAGSDAAVNVNLQTGTHTGGHAAGDTLSSIEYVEGSAHGDTLAGDTGGNTLDGAAGDDVLIGWSGADSLVGGDGSDTASYAGSGAAVNVNLQTGTHSGGHAAGDTLGGIENLSGSGHGDTLTGDAGDNVLDGAAGDDVLIGWSGADSLVGGGGDTASYAGSDAAVNVNLHTGNHSGGHAAGDSLGGIENLSGSDHGDTLTGDAGDNVLDGAAGDDVLIGWSGADSLVGGGGSDTASYAGSDTAVSVNLQTGTHSGGHAAGDTLTGIENLTGSAHGDTLTGDTGGNILDGGGGDDWLDGGDGNDWLVGGSGEDTLAGRLGTDTLTGGGGNDRFVFDGALGDQHIADFSAGDRIDFAFGLVAHFAALDTDGSGVLDSADADIFISGGDTIISVGGGQITVENDIGLESTDFFYF